MTDLKPTYDSSHALVIGINDYPLIGPLDSAVHDAEGVAELLQEGLGFSVKLLRDSEATRDSIYEHIDACLCKTGPDDRVVLYFAGHGITRHTSGGGQSGLLSAV